MFPDKAFLCLWLMITFPECLKNFFKVQLHKLPLCYAFMFHLERWLKGYMLVFHMESWVESEGFERQILSSCRFKPFNGFSREKTHVWSIRILGNNIVEDFLPKAASNIIEQCLMICFFICYKLEVDNKGVGQKWISRVQQPRASRLNIWFVIFIAQIAQIIIIIVKFVCHDCGKTCFIN